MIPGGEEENLLVGLDAQCLEGNGNRDVLMNGVVPEVDLALLCRDIRLGLETAMSRASKNESGDMQPVHGRTRQTHDVHEA